MRPYDFVQSKIQTESIQNHSKCTPVAYDCKCMQKVASGGQLHSLAHRKLIKMINNHILSL